MSSTAAIRFARHSAALVAVASVTAACGDEASTVDGVEGEVPVKEQGPYTLGVRPTDIELGQGPLSAQVDVVESLGAEALVHLDLGGQPLVAQVAEPVQVAAGDRVALGFARVHRFDRDTGARRS